MACETCTGPKPTDCKTCSKAGNYFKLGNTTCLKNCPTKQYGDNATKKCNTCPKGCTNCSSNSSCGGCDKGFVRKNSSSMSNQFFGENETKPGQTCQSCNQYLSSILKQTPWTSKPWNNAAKNNGSTNPKCAECSEKGNCTKCETGFFLHESEKICVKSCAKGYWPEKTNS